MTPRSGGRSRDRFALLGAPRPRASFGAIAIAWVSVGLRVLHSVVHLSYIHVIHRLAVFSLSNVALVGLW